MRFEYRQSFSPAFVTFVPFVVKHFGHFSPAASGAAR